MSSPGENKHPYHKHSDLSTPFPISPHHSPSSPFINKNGGMEVRTEFGLKVIGWFFNLWFTKHIARMCWLCSWTAVLRI
jgi:hypothetical protein